MATLEIHPLGLAARERARAASVRAERGTPCARRES